MLFFHGTKVQGIEVLRPFKSQYSNLKKMCIYLSTNRALASIYIWDMPFKWMTFGFTEEGIPEYEESFPNALETFYKGVKGSLYICDGDYEMSKELGIEYVATPNEHVEVKEEIAINDALEWLLELERKGELVIKRHEDYSDDDHAKTKKMVLGVLKRLNLKKDDHPITPFVRDTFPEYWKEALSDGN